MAYLAKLAVAVAVAAGRQMVAVVAVAQVDAVALLAVEVKAVVAVSRCSASDLPSSFSTAHCLLPMLATVGMV